MTTDASKRAGRGVKGFPSREEWLAAGFVACSKKRCHILVNPSEIERCARHRKPRG